MADTYTVFVFRNGELVELTGSGGDPSDPGGQTGEILWSEIDGKPAIFPPTPHNHEITEVIDLTERLEDVETAVAAFSTTGLALTNPTTNSPPVGDRDTSIPNTGWFSTEVWTTANMAPGTVKKVAWSGTGTPDRTTARTDITVMWVVTNDVTPPVVTSGTAGAYEGDIQLRRNT